MLNRIFHSFFFGNYFYGFCVVALSLESSFQLGRFPHSIYYYLILFCATVVYYTYAYQYQTNSSVINERVLWYTEHKRQINISQLLLLFVLILSSILYVKQNDIGYLNVSSYSLFSMFLFPLVAIFYYGGMSTRGKNYNLRKVGWLKPFIIGFVWSGIVSIYPAVITSFEDKSNYQLTILISLHFSKNFLFITILCIMFDIKDYADDSNKQLKTFVVRFGLRNTIFYILLPLSLMGLFMFLTYAMLLHFRILRILFNTIPFVLLISVAYSMYQRKRIFYYLVFIDGLMLIKALCGILGMILT